MLRLQLRAVWHSDGVDGRVSSNSGNFLQGNPRLFLGDECDIGGKDRRHSARHFNAIRTTIKGGDFRTQGTCSSHRQHHEYHSSWCGECQRFVFAM
jgi:hypothetical protein